MRAPDARPAARDEPVQDPLVQTRRDPPGPPARTSQLQAPSLPRLGKGCFFERPQTASRQRPDVDLLLRLAHRGERRVRPQRSEEHTSELQSRQYLVCRLLLEKKQPARLMTSDRRSI